MAMLRVPLKVIAKAVAPAIDKLEFSTYQTVRTNDEEPTPVFIIGSPRCGSTVLSQMIISTFDYLYVNNLTEIFNRSLPFGMRLSDLFFRETQASDFSSKYGITSGFNEASECPAFWFRWFPRGRDFVESSEISDSSKSQMYKNINLIKRRYSKDMLFKNLTIGQRIRVISAVFPQSKFIYLRRNPYYVAQSVLLARKTLNIDEAAWWSVKPSNYEELSRLPVVERIVGQIYFHERQIIDDLLGLPVDRKFALDYTEIAQKFGDIAVFLNTPAKVNLALDDFDFTNSNKLDNGLRDQVLKALENYDWKKLGYEC